MEQSRVRIVDITQTLGLSTATVSNVIHGKTEKLSDETVKRVQQELERTEYIPNMAGILLARNNSRIIGVVVNDHYALEFMRFLQGQGIRVPEDVQIIGFDDTLASRESIPALTTIHQDAALRARTAIRCLEALRDGTPCDAGIVLPVELVERESTRRLPCQTL